MAVLSNQVPRVVGGFEILSKLGEGGMGAVFKARQPALDRVVALKILPPKIAQDANFIERFQREARASAKLNHPNIVQGIDVGKDEATGLWFFAMEFVDGPSLKKVLETEKALPEKRALEIACDVARALECAERHGIVHRDIKPDNILLDERGAAKLADLGLAKQVHDDASLTQSGMAVGTPYYMAPEQARGESDQIDIRTDLYALGATLFHLVTGQPLFDGPTAAVIMTKHLSEKAPQAQRVSSQVSEACGKLIARLTQKQKHLRVQSPAELLELLERMQAQGTATGPQSPSRAGHERGSTSARLVPVRGLATGPRAPVGGPDGARGRPVAAASWAVAAGWGAGVLAFAGGLAWLFASGAPDRPAARNQDPLGTKAALPANLGEGRTAEKRAVAAAPSLLTSKAIPAPLPEEPPAVKNSTEAPPVFLPPPPALPPVEVESGARARVKLLRERLIPLGRNAPRDQVRLLGESPQPEEPGTVLYRASFERGQPDGWLTDYESKVTVVSEHGETGLKIELGGKDRLACYRHLKYPINRTRVRMHVWPAGLRALQLSVLTVFLDRFTIPVPLPAPNRWSNVEVELGSALANGIKLANQPVAHVELHGFPAGQNPVLFLSKFEWVNGGGNQAQAAPSSSAPALGPLRTPEAPSDGLSAARAAYATFTEEFLGCLREGDTKSAAERLSKAEKDPALGSRAADLARDRKALGWSGDLEEAAGRGAEKLKDTDAFSLRMKQGAPVNVGRKALFQIDRVEKGILYLGGKGLAMPLPLDKLHPQARSSLALLGLGEDGAGHLRRAWAELLCLGTRTEAVSASAVRTALEKAKAAGADPEDVKYLAERLEGVEQGAHERAAAAAWDDVLKLAAEKKWKPLLASLEAFQTHHVASGFGKKKSGELEALRAKAGHEVDLAEGYGFNFATADQFERFKKLFPKPQAMTMELLHEPGRLIFRRKENAPGGGLHLQTDAVKLGRNWDLNFRVSLGIGVKEVQEKSSEGRHDFHVRFMTPGERAILSTESHPRFHLEMVSGYGGFLCCALRGPGQCDNGTGRLGPFEGIQKNFPPGGDFLGNGKARPPAGADGKYDVRMSVHGGQMKVTANGLVVVETVLPPPAAALIENSPLALFAYVSDQAREIVLEELFLKSRDEP